MARAWKFINNQSYILFIDINSEILLLGFPYLSFEHEDDSFPSFFLAFLPPFLQGYIFWPIFIEEKNSRKEWRRGKKGRKGEKGEGKREI